MVRLARTQLRFGSCERRLHPRQPQQLERLAAEWMAAGFSHGVLNTDTMSLTGESFDYGPFALVDQWDPGFTAAFSTTAASMPTADSP